MRSLAALMRCGVWKHAFGMRSVKSAGMGLGSAARGTSNDSPLAATAAVACLSVVAGSATGAISATTRKVACWWSGDGSAASKGAGLAGEGASIRRIRSACVAHTHA